MHNFSNGRICDCVQDGFPIMLMTDELSMIINSRNCNDINSVKCFIQN